MMSVDGKTKTIKGEVLSRHEKVEQILLESTGKSISRAMIEAGFAPGYAKNPQDLKATKQWQKIRQKYLKPAKIGAKYAQLLEASKLDRFVFPNTMSDEEIKQVIEQIPGAKFIKTQRNQQWARAFFTIPDNMTQADMVKTGLKAWGQLGGETDDNKEQGSVELEAAIIRIRSILPDSIQ